MAKKESILQKYWKIIKVPVLIFIGYSILASIVAAISFETFMTFFGGWSGLIITVVVFGFIGYTTVKEHKQGIGQAAAAGAIAGVIAGLAGAVLSILMSFIAPHVIEQTVQQIVAQGGMAREQAESLVTLLTYLGLVIGPVRQAIIGTILALIGGALGLIGKKK